MTMIKRESQVLGEGGDDVSSGYTSLQKRTPSPMETIKAQSTNNNPCKSSGSIEKNLEPRESIALTSIALNDNEEKGDSLSDSCSLILQSNLTRLKMAYGYLTPIVDDVIKRATSYTQKEFLHLLQTKTPICSITYNQYIKAYQASQLYHQVGLELQQSNHVFLTQPDIIVNNVATIKRQDLLSNISKMADRIFIDKDLMKQLVDLHELITDTIKRLTKSLDKEFDGIGLIPSEMGLDLDDHNSVTSIDKLMLRDEIAENFIVVGDPKKGDNCCYWKYAQQNETVLQTNTKGSKIDNSVAQEPLTESDKKSSSARSSKRASKQKAKRESKNSTKEAKVSKQKGSKQVAKDSLQMKELSKESKHSAKESKQSTKASLQMKEPAKESKHSTKASKQWTKDSVQWQPMNTEMVPSKMTERELEDYILKKKVYTATVDSGYHIDYDENISQARAVLPNPSDLISNQGEPNSTMLFTTNLEAAAASSSRIIANSESEVSLSQKEESFRYQPTNQSATVLGECSRECAKDGTKCDEAVVFLKRMFSEVGTAIQDIKQRHSVEEFNEKHRVSKGKFQDLIEAENTQKEIFGCLKELKKIKDLLKNMNDSELIVEKLGQKCCERNYLHLHARIHGISLVIRITKSTLDLLLGREAAPHKVEKSCMCKPYDIRSRLFPKNIKCPLASNIKSMLTPNQKKHGAEEHVVMEISSLEQPTFSWQDSTTSSSFTFDDLTLSENQAYKGRELDVYEIMELHDSNTSLPYVVHRRSLPNIDACESMQISISEMRQRMRSSRIEHPRARIERQLKQLGIETILRASTPARCCRKAVINEKDVDSEPFRASLSSLPLTTSDLLLINEVADQECMLPRLLQLYQSKFEYYTNFQENFTSNLDYFVPRHRVYQVRYFELFKSSTPNMREENDHHRYHHQRRSHHAEPSNGRRHHRESASSHNQNNNNTTTPIKNNSRSFLSDLFRKLIFYNTDSEDVTEEVIKEKKVYHGHKEASHKKTRIKTTNRRCQTSCESFADHKLKHQKDSNEEVPEQILPIQWRAINANRANTNTSRDQIKIEEQIHRKYNKKCLPGDINDTSSLSPTNYAETINAIYELDSGGRLKSKPRLSKMESKKSGNKDKEKVCTTCNNNNLGTIYETDEKLANKELQDHRRGANYESFYEFLRSPEISASFQKFITSESCMKDFEKNNIDAEQFWSMYFEARKSYRQMKAAAQKFQISASSIETTPIASNSILQFPSSHDNTCVRKTKMKFAKSSKIPKRVKKPPTSYSASSSEVSSREAITPEDSSSPRRRSPSSRTTEEHKNKDREGTKRSSSSRRPPEVKRIPSITKTNTAKIYFTEMFDDSTTIKSQQTTELNSLQSLQVLASKNGPGYITVLHPICGCPEVSIFIPCYCEDEGYPKRAALSAKKVSRLMGVKDGRHIVLPGSCRIPKITTDTNNNKKKPENSGGRKRLEAS